MNTITDSSIRNAVEREIIFDPAVQLNNVEVAVKDHVVTLEGVVDNHLTKDWAAKVASTVRGVRSVVNLISVNPHEDISAEALSKRVHNALVEDPATDSYEVEVTADANGKCVLTGTVDSWQERHLAEQVTKGVNGVTKIENDITVHYKLNRPDSEIQPEIKKTLRWNSLIDDALIEVEVKDGNAKLTGTVGSVAEKSRAKAFAWVAGVESVDVSELKVARWARDDDLRMKKYVNKPDSEIQAAVKDALQCDPRVVAFNVTPEVEHGTATLRGTVDNLKAKRAAEADARNTVGIHVVQNRLKVKPGKKLTEAEIESKVRNALKQDVFVDKYEVTAKVNDGVVDLYGTVDSFFEKSHADDAASRCNGVVDVHNHLSVTNPGLFVYDPYVYTYTWYPDTFRWYHPPYVMTTRTDASIKDDIKDELWWSPFVDADDITVAVKDGKATLTGTVDSYSELDAARENAYEGGAINVVCDLTVTSNMEDISETASAR